MTPHDKTPPISPAPVEIDRAAGLIRLRDPQVFGPGGTPHCERFLRRALIVEGINSIEIDTVDERAVIHVNPERMRFAFAPDCASDPRGRGRATAGRLASRCQGGSIPGPACGIATHVLAGAGWPIGTDPVASPTAAQRPGEGPQGGTVDFPDPGRGKHGTTAGRAAFSSSITPTWSNEIC